MIEQFGIESDQLKSFIDRIERLEEEKGKILQDIKEVYSEAKSWGFDTKTIRKVISLRAKSEREREEEETLLDLYKRAVGLAPDLEG